MKRWLKRAGEKIFAGCAATVVALVTLSGCQPVFMSVDMYKDAHIPLGERTEAPTDPYAPTASALTPAPATVSKPNRPPRYVSMQEAIAIALENGHVSSRTGAGSGLVDNTMLSFSGQGSLTPGQTERMRVLALNPAFAQAAMEASLSRYDAFFVSTMNWTGISGLAGVPNLGSNVPNSSLGSSEGNSARFETAVVKPLATGAVASVGWLTDYRQFGNNAFLLANGANQSAILGLYNPQYSTRVSFNIEQPILKDFGVFMNELLPRFPSATGNSLDSATSGALGNRGAALSGFVDRNTEGILISRLRFDQARAEFERNVHILMVNTEVAYWNLYGKYGQLYSAQENLRIMHTVWQITYNRYKEGAMPPGEYFQILAQYEEFRGEHLRALQEVLDAERNLRGILGLPVEDGSRIVPITPPNMTELKNNWELAVQDTLKLRPELVLARDNIRNHQYLVNLQYNNLKPDLRAYARYEPFGDGSTLTGSGQSLDGSGTLQPNNAFRSLTNGHLADWQIGLSLTVPLGYRAEFAAIRAAKIELTQAYLLLRDQEDKAVRILAEQHQQLDHWYKRIEAHRSERLAYLKGLGVRIAQITEGKLNPAGGQGVSTLDFLDNQRRYAAAQVKEFDAIAQYNSTLARLEFAKGTILQYNNVHISEGALPQAALVRAVEIEKERSKALVVLQRPDSLSRPGTWCVDKEKDLPGLAMPTGEASKLSSMSGITTPPPPPPGIMTMPGTAPASNVMPVEFRPDVKTSAPSSMAPPPPLPTIEIADTTLSQPRTAPIPARMPTGGVGFVTPEGASPPQLRDAALPTPH